MEHTPLFTNDAVVLGLLLLTLTAVFLTSNSDRPFFQKFYTFVPPLLLCYFLPALMNWPLGWISAENSKLYFVASRFLLPASLVLLCLGIDFKSLINLGPKAIIMFLAGTVGVILGGPIALFFTLNFFPDIIAVPADQLWRGLSTIAGSWIGGGGNQAAMREIYDVSADLFSIMVVVDVVVANIWMGFLLYGANMNKRIDLWLKADNSAIVALEEKVSTYRASVKKTPTTTDLFVLMSIAFGAVGLSHLMSDAIVPQMELHIDWLNTYGLSTFASGFFWLIVIATTIGLILSFTPLRKMEGMGASNWGSVYIYILVATIGMEMNLLKVYENLGLFMVGIIWMLVHVAVLLLVAKLIKAPFFFVAVGSQANIGGAASAPVVASAFSPSLAPVGALMAVLGYALGTYGAIICALLMKGVVG